METFEDHETFRSFLVDGLRRQLFGPTPDDADDGRTETLTISPLQLYATGVLFPQKMRRELLEDEREPVEAGENLDGELDDTPSIQQGRRERETDTESASTEREPLNLANEFSPSACGISFRLKERASLIVSVSYGVYAGVKVSEPNLRAGSIGKDGRPVPESREIPGYRRTHVEREVRLDLGSKIGALAPIDVSDDQGLKLHTTVRKRSDGTFVVSTMLVNHRTAGGGVAPSYEDAFFQSDLTVRTADGAAAFLPIDRSVGAETDDAEIASMDLLYRHRRAFALGHGVAADWNRDESLSESGVTDMVRTSAVPTYDLKPIKPREQAFRENAALTLSMAFLYDAGHKPNPSNEIASVLDELADDYGAWIVHQQAVAAELDGQLRAAADKNLDDCRACHARMVRGIEILRNNAQAMLAFRLMNKAMLVQQHHSRLPPREPGSKRPSVADYGRERKWRPFQLAFILMNIASMSTQDDDERRIVDLIWFPTGGGKTEAYLGLAAFAICLERLKGVGAGTRVLMRYTLRLLTAQQFQRASALILALETIRTDRDLEADLGDETISIGLWVGQSLSPNTRDQARSALRSLRQNKFASNPFQVLQCPWCGMAFTDRSNLGYREVSAQGGAERTVRFVCPDDTCRFGGGSSGLPIFVVDEDIYDAPPTLLIGTVDKFAQIAWDDRVGRIFGIDVGAPPSLVIQDELHLISGPLGTIVGLYETAIDRLCSRGEHVHKIVASTATIRRADDQCRALYARNSFQFPPQGLRAGESYFAMEDRSAPGRLYVGFMGSAVKSHQTALVRACSPLLQGACYGAENDNEEKRSITDPYGTLVWYFNSLRELGHAATLCVGDIPEFLKGLCHRLKIPYENRRYIREIVELTSRRNADEIPAILQQLDIPWRIKPAGPQPVDVLLATNMIAVGVDVSRLGLIVMSGQPKSTSEYIQASSRVGRAHPGLVVTVYAQTKSRDRSHYERFVAYHQSMYRYVEPTSVTPFSPQARERGLRGVLIALARLLAEVSRPSMISSLHEAVTEQIDAIVARAANIDKDEAEDTRRELNDWVEFWLKYTPPQYGRMGGAVAEQTLAYPFGSVPDEEFQRDAWPVLTSMRNVDGTSVGRVLNVYEADTEAAD